jgi:DNA-binding transcriptional ArsR family regulator
MPELVDQRHEEPARAREKGDDGGRPGVAAEASKTGQYPLPEDELFHVLQNERRRAVLRYLDGREEVVRMRDVAEQIAAWEYDTTVALLDSDERQRVYISLYQSHLPKLDDAGIVEYDQARGNVRLTECGQAVADFMLLTGSAEERFDWTDDSVPYLAATAAGFILVGGATTGFGGLLGLTPLTASVLVILLFTAVTLSRLLPSPH